MRVSSSRKLAVSIHVYEVRPRKDRRGVDLISDILPFGRLWYDKPDHAKRLRQRGLRLARPEKVRPVGLAKQTKEQHGIVFCIHVVHETASQNRWTPQQALQQLFVLLILRLRNRHAFPVEAQLADRFGLDLH